MHVRSSLVNKCECQVAAVVNSAPMSRGDEIAGVFQMVSSNCGKMSAQLPACICVCI